MISVSTEWNRDRTGGHAEAVAELLLLGQRHLALEGACTVDEAARVHGLARAKKAVFAVVFAPAPGDAGHRPGDGGRARDRGAGGGLASPRPEIGEAAVRAALVAADAAARVGCRDVVLRVGSLPCLDPGRDARWHEQMLEEGQTATLHAEVLAAVAADRPDRDRMLDALCERLHALLTARPDSRFHIETPSGVQGLPHPEEAVHLLDAFRGRKLGYWHDAGHAAHLMALGIARQEHWLARLASVTGGLTVCDWSPLGGRLPPNAGLVGWKDLRFQTLPRWPRVLALDADFPAALLDDALRELAELGF